MSFILLFIITAPNILHFKFSIPIPSQACNILFLALCLLLSFPYILSPLQPTLTYTYSPQVNPTSFPGMMPLPVWIK
ncbi:hypothetical protein L873DRAFT_1797483 [Choiromyces venosus 120613-1]|uniref:Uncharacterized protein n=1 Tax=Choiromyces venosus 120613-1 TaxID=1336337 RepID=A0A3N4K8Z6_9PEZI|nr:hypothetical protein L873DRAFT_1797483 [Choiromyces venosus 120613-1]